MRGERERVADRVRQLLGVPAPTDEPARRWRWDPGRRGALAMGAAVLAVIAALLWWMASARPEAVPVTPLGASSAPPIEPGTPAQTGDPPGAASSSPSGSSSPAVLVVDVAGKVVHPGIYRLPVGARVYDAVQAAGGPRPGVDLVSINLAAPLLDGQQVVVGLPGSVPTQPGAPGSAGASTAASIVDLNSATLEQLETLPGVGPVLGQNILDWRDAHGQFASLDQLQDVSGIGPAKYAEIKDLVSL